ncbi:unnamed protein product, partial [Urochloa humidicola]
PVFFVLRLAPHAPPESLAGAPAPRRRSSGQHPCSPPSQLRLAPPFLAFAAPAGGPGRQCISGRRHCSAPDLRAAAVPALPLSQPRTGRTSPSLSSRPDPSRTPPPPPRTVSSPTASPLWQRRPAPPLAAEDRTHIALPLLRIPRETSRRRLAQIRQDLNAWSDGFLLKLITLIRPVKLQSSSRLEILAGVQRRCH